MPKWGRAVGRKTIANYDVKILEPRPANLLAVLEEAEKWGDREFLVYDDRRITFGEFLSATARAAARLTAAGVRDRDVVLLNAANSPEFLAAFWGILRVGGVVALGNAWWSTEEISSAVSNLGLRCAVSDEKRDALIAGHATFANVTRLRLEDFADDFASATPAGGIPDQTGFDEERPAVLIFTSGATGKPKPAILSHRALIAGIQNIFLFRGALPSEIPLDAPQATVLCATPLFHVGGTLIQAMALIGGTRIAMLAGRSEGRRLLELIARERVNSISTVPTILARILDHPELHTFDLSSIVAISASGSMVSPDLIARAKAALPNVNLASGSTYGMTETAGSISMIAGDDHTRKPTSSGRPFATCEVRIAEPDAHGEGEIFVRTPSAMSGYWGMPDHNMIDAEGWVHTGDLGRIDDEGFIHVTGRSKDIIIRGGENIAASVIEERLEEHPGIAEAAVIGLPHHDLGEEVGAVIVPRPGQTVDVGELATFVRETLSYFQVPSRWWLHEEPLPTNPVGKVLKPQLRAQWPETC